MQIGDTIVNTPYEDSTQFDVDWRHLIARSWSDTGKRPKGRKIYEDKWIIAQKKFLDELKKKDDDVTAIHTNLHGVLPFKWKTGRNLTDTRFWLEPLLLTGATYDIIAADLGGYDLPVEVIEYYEKVYLNVRDSRGRLNESCPVRTRAALPLNGVINEGTPQEIVWRVVASQCGYSVIVSLWRWPQPHGELAPPSMILDEVFRQLQANILERALRNQINAFDLNNLLGQYTNYERMRHDTNQQVNANKEMVMTLARVLEAVTPHMVEASMGVDDHNKRNKQLAARIKEQTIATDQAIGTGHLDEATAHLGEIVEDFMTFKETK
jgi:hypothetical protein